MPPTTKMILLFPMLHILKYTTLLDNYNLTSSGTYYSTAKQHPSLLPSLIISHLLIFSNIPNTYVQISYSYQGVWTTPELFFTVILYIIFRNV